LHLTQRKVDVEEKMKTTKIIKKGKQHQLLVMSSSICVEIGELQSHVKHSSSLPQGNINYFGVTKSNFYDKYSLLHENTAKKIDVEDT